MCGPWTRSGPWSCMMWSVGLGLTCSILGTQAELRTMGKGGRHAACSACNVLLDCARVLALARPNLACRLAQRHPHLGHGAG